MHRHRCTGIDAQAVIAFVQVAAKAAETGVISL
jgi:hypothetical protein